LAREPPSEAAARGSDGSCGSELADKVSTFGGDLLELSDAELERRAEAYLRRQEDRYKERAESYLGFEGSWSTEVGHDGD